MTGPWTIVVPEAGRNKVLNPSAELAGNFAAYNGSTVTQDTTHARFGYQSYKIVTGAVNRGMDVTMEALNNAIHYATLYVFGMANPTTLQISFDSAVTFNAVSIIGGSTGAWVRVGFAIPAAQANASVTFRIRNTANETFWADAFQAEANSYFTTYMDGDFGGLYRWTGLRAASASTRDAQDRGGGRERNLLDDYGIKVRQNIGAGMPPTTLNTLAQSLQPGSTFQSSKVQPRLVTFQTDLFSNTQQPAGLHMLRETLINLIKSDAVRGNQAFILGYTVANSGKKVYAQFRYQAGLELGRIDAGPTYIEQDAKVPVSMLAVDPFWYEDSQDQTSLTLQNTLTSDARVAARINGVWSKLGTGFNNTVTGAVYDAQRGRIYFVGIFTTANGVTVNGVCYWNGTTFVAMDAGVGAGAGTLEVDSIALAPNGDVWIGGKFRTVGSGAAACKGLAKWSAASSSWTAFNNTTTLFTSVYTIAIDQTSGNVYIGGNFTGWDGSGSENYIAKYNGSVWSAVGTSPFSSTLYPGSYQSFFIDSSGNLYSGSLQTGTGTASFLKWNGSAWTTIAVTDSAANRGIFSVVLAPSGVIYLGGLYSTLGGISSPNIAAYAGNAIVAVPNGPPAGSNDVTAIAFTPDGLMVVLGSFVLVGSGLSASGVTSYAYWNGYSWIGPDVLFPGSPVNTEAVVCLPNGDIYIGGDFNGTTTTSAQTTVTVSGSAAVFPVIVIQGTTTAGAVTYPVWIENASSGQRLFPSVTVYAGETITIDCRSGRKIVTSDWRGVLSNQPLSPADFALFALLPGNNTLTVMVFGTIAGATVLVQNVPAHWSVDTVA